MQEQAVNSIIAAAEQEKGSGVVFTENIADHVVRHRALIRQVEEARLNVVTFLGLFDSCGCEHPGYFVEPDLPYPEPILVRNNSRATPPCVTQRQFHSRRRVDVRRVNDDVASRLASRQEVDHITANARIKNFAMTSAVRSEVMVQANQRARLQVFAQPVEHVGRIVECRCRQRRELAAQKRPHCL